jgi:putative DNA primase/helicase
MGNLSNILGGSFTPPAEAIPKSPEVQLIEAMMDAGITPPAQVHLDGKIHRFCASGKKGDSGWYVVFSDGVPAGQFGDWRTGVAVSFRADVGRQLTAIEEMAHTRRMAEAKAIREQEEKVKHEVAANTVEIIWSSATHAGADHPYLKRKQIETHGARVTGDGRLIVPLYNAEGKLCSIQYISGDGDKKYHPGGETGECFWTIGEYDATKPVYIAEGFATAATIAEVTGAYTIVAYSASNLVPVTRIAREQYNNSIIIVADNDTSGTGQKYADQAAAKYGAKVVMPPTHGDANDYVASGGDLINLLNPPADDWLVQADDFSAKPSPLKWFVKDWLQEKALIMVHGPSGAGKSFLVLDWCLRMASGLTDWAGHKVKPVNVLYLAGEGHWGLKGRIAAFKQKHNVNNLSMFVSKSGVDINTPEGYRQVTEHIRSLPFKPDMIVIDTLHRFYHGDENSSQDAKTMLEACAALMREFDCSILLVHHTGVSEEAQHRARGSSAWRGALDIEISVTPLKSENEGTAFSIVQRKAKDSELARPIFARLEVVSIAGWFDEDGDQVTSAVVEITEAPEDKSKGVGIGEYVKLWGEAWFQCGKEFSENGNPIISRSALADYLQKKGIYEKESAIKAALSPSNHNKFIGALILADIIRVHNAGVKGHTRFEAVNGELCASLTLQNGA